MKAKAAPPAQNGHGANGNDAAEEEGLEEDDDDEFTAMREVRIYVGEEQCECESLRAPGSGGPAARSPSGKTNLTSIRLRVQEAIPSGGQCTERN